jgi:very-short-patch-repair endonuclease
MPDQRLLDFARRNRSALSPFEARLWARISGSKLNSYKFRRQHVIDHAITDFFCPRKGLIVEVDGDTHDRQRDAARDATHLVKGWTTIRFTNADVGKNIEGVLARLVRTLDSLPDRWPHPCPSPEGEGK